MAILAYVVYGWSLFRKFKEERHALRRLQNSTSLVWIVVLHAVLTTPGNVAYIIWNFSGDDQLEPVPLYNFFYVLYVIGHCINHILYCLTNKQIQEETSKILFQCKNIYWSR